ncbi:MAG: glycosyltransferase family 4 protein [Desulfobulbaceae bacterium]|nr:MAG: glycosyltransferase family 4 protein [Desulfobulbaceae bacterium]
MPFGLLFPANAHPSFPAFPQLPMNILHIISQHPGSTGSGIYLQNLLRQAEACGHRNYLVAGISSGMAPRLDGVGAECCCFIRFAEGDLDFAIPGMSDVMPYASSRFSDLPPEAISRYEQVFTKKIRGIAETFAVDVVHSHHLWLVSAVARRVLPEMPMVTSCHSTELRQFVQCPHLSDRVLEDCRRIDRILALSENQAEQITRLYAVDREKIAVVGSGFDDRLFTFADKPAAGPVQFLYAGKLSHAKGVDWLLRVFGGLDAGIAHLHLAGSGIGEEARECLELAGNLGSRLTVHGALSQQDLAGLMRRCHVFILPSFYEGLPLVLLEALASGCRIVTTALPGCRELLAEVAGDLVEFIELPPMATVDRPGPRDWEKLDADLREAVFAMVDRVHNSPSLQRGDTRKITDRSSWRVVFGRIEDAYARAMRCHGRR